VLKHGAPHEKCKKHLDGAQCQQAITQYGNRQHTFRDICGSNSARPTQNPMMEINAKIISYIHSSIFKSSGSEKKKKLKIVSEPKHHHQSVGDFCVLDSVPGENCNNLYEVLFILYYDY